jgi:ABC-type multidrug transport system ATPase subunit
LTVKEILKFNADARLPVTTTKEEKESLINDIIEVLGLSYVKYNIIGDVEQRGLSGGERKRVNIGMELASDPNGNPLRSIQLVFGFQLCLIFKISHF